MRGAGAGCQPFCGPAGAAGGAYAGAPPVICVSQDGSGSSPGRAPACPAPLAPRSQDGSDCSSMSDEAGMPSRALPDPLAGAPAVAGFIHEGRPWLSYPCAAPCPPICAQPMPG